MMTVPSQLEGVQLGGNVTLRCRSEAFPASINYWVKGEREETVSSGPRRVAVTRPAGHVTTMALTLLSVTQADIASYRCVAKAPR